MRTPANSLCFLYFSSNHRDPIPKPLYQQVEWWAILYFDKHNSTQSGAWDIDSPGADVNGASSSVASEMVGFHASHRFRGRVRYMTIWGLRVLRGERSNSSYGGCRPCFCVFVVVCRSSLRL